MEGCGQAARLESRDEYTAEGVFWVPPEARWQYLKAPAKQPEIGKLIDNAMAVEQPVPRCGSSVLSSPATCSVLPSEV